VSLAASKYIASDGVLSLRCGLKVWRLVAKLLEKRALAFGVPEAAQKTRLILLKI
jgi:hypothetical protein